MAAVSLVQKALRANNSVAQWLTEERSSESEDKDFEVATIKWRRILLSTTFSI